jgi:NAD(P)-dependent dehydrogenase (short-subunit alcohol dehydrogenase family)
MSSVAGLRGWTDLGVYCTTKGGVRLFAKAGSDGVRAEADGIRIKTVNPGVIDPPIWTNLPVSAGSNAPIDPNEVAETGYRSEGLGRRRILQMACSPSPLTRRVT